MGQIYNDEFSERGRFEYKNHKLSFWNHSNTTYGRYLSLDVCSIFFPEDLHTEEHKRIFRNPYWGTFWLQDLPGYLNYRQTLGRPLTEEEAKDFLRNAIDNKELTRDWVKANLHWSSWPMSRWEKETSSCNQQDKRLSDPVILLRAE